MELVKKQMGNVGSIEVFADKNGIIIKARCEVPGLVFATDVSGEIRVTWAELGKFLEKYK